MLKGRRVGTFTAGITLITFGVLFLIHILYPMLNYKFIFSLWPVILIMLGAEIILSYIVNSNEKIRYDGGAVAIIIILALFAMCMGGTQFILENSRYFNGTYYIN